MRLPPPIHDDVRDLRRGRFAAAVMAVVGALAAVVHVTCPATPAVGDELVAEVRAASSDAQDYWSDRLPYRRADVVVFAGKVWTLCGALTEVEGPTYCRATRAVYVDVAWLRRLAPDSAVARAYVVGHEVGHHVQALSGSTADGPARELQADCLAGAWLGDLQRRGLLDVGDAASVDAVATSVGDDVVGGSGHGTSAQRVASVEIGVRGGPAACGAR